MTQLLFLWNLWLLNFLSVFFFFILIFDFGDETKKKATSEIENFGIDFRWIRTKSGQCQLSGRL